MSQPQQQQHQKPSEPKDALSGFTPDPYTYWFLQTYVGLEKLAKLEILQRYGSVPGRIVSSLHCQWLSDRHTIVPVYVDPNEPVKDAETGRLRLRRLGGKDADPINVKFGKPIKCTDVTTASADTGAIQVQIKNGTDEDGKSTLGLLSRLERACRRRDENGREAALIQARYRIEDGGVITLSDV